MYKMTQKVLLAAVMLTMLASGAVASPADPAQSMVDPVILGNSSGNPIGGGFVVKPRDVNGSPADRWLVEIRFLNTGGRPYSTQVDGSTIDCGVQTISRVVDSIGDAVFYPRIGGFENLEVIEIRADGILLARVVARSTDLNADGATGLADLELFRVNFFGNQDAQETDYDLTGSTDLGDLDIFRTEFHSGAGGTLCN